MVWGLGARVILALDLTANNLTLRRVSTNSILGMQKDINFRNVKISSSM
jgi:hypothetical protein